MIVRGTIRWSLAVLFALLVLSGGSLQGQADTDRLAIVGGFLIDGTEGPPIENSVVLVEGDRITDVGTVADTEIPEGARVIDANGRTVMPGLMDAHVHLWIAGHGVYPEWDATYQERFREIMPISARELLHAGVTSVREMGGPLDDLLWMKEQVASGQVDGPRIFTAGPFLQKDVLEREEFFRWEVDGAEDARSKTRQLIEEGVDLIKVIQLPQLTEGERSAIAREAHDAGLPIAVHASSLEAVRLAAEMGVASIEHVGAGAKPEYPKETVRLMADHGIAASLTSIVGKIYDITKAYPERLDDPRLKRDFPDDIYRDILQSLEHFSRLGYFEGAKDANRTHPRKTRQLYNGGVDLVIGTDSGTPMNFHYESTWQEMDLFVRYGIPPMKVVSMATRHNAELFGAADELGTVEPGKLADIIVVDGNPLRHMSALQNVEHVIKGGEVVK